MKTTSLLTKQLFTGLVFFTSSLLTYTTKAQDSSILKERQKIHLKITEERNGKTLSIDTVYTADQQDAISAHLKKLGFSKPTPPPAPPIPPLPPTPPSAPLAPLPPVPPQTKERSYSFRLRDNNLSKMEKDEMEKEMEKLKEDLHSIEMEGLADFDTRDINIQLDGNFISKEDQEKFNEDMSKIKLELKDLEENLKELKIEIIEENGDDQEKTDQPEEKERSENDTKPRHCIAYTFDINEIHPEGIDRENINQKKENQVICIVNKEDGNQNIIRLGMPGELKNSPERHQMIISKKRTKKAENKKPSVVEAVESTPKPEQKEPKNSYSLNPLAFNAFPNPGDGLINLSFTLSGDEAVTIKIIDATGKTVYEETLENSRERYEKQIDLTNNGKGIYLLSVTQGDKWMHKKLVIK